MIYRPQRGSLAESMDARVMLLSSKAALAKHLDMKVEDIEVKPYYDMVDPRTRWRETFLVTYNGYGIGFTDTEVK